jgi:hypothetical protein
MENIIRGPTFDDVVTILTEASMQDNTIAPHSPFIKCQVLRESLSEDSQIIPWGTLKRRGRG